LPPDGSDKRREKSAGKYSSEDSAGGRADRYGSELKVRREEVEARLAVKKEAERAELQARLGAEQRRDLRAQAQQKRLGVKELKVSLLLL
jgi:hypothetical protein